MVSISQCGKHKIGHSHNTLFCIKGRVLVTCHTVVVVYSVGSATVQHSVIFRENCAHLSKAALNSSSVSSLEWGLDLSLKLLHVRKSERFHCYSYTEDALCMSQIISISNTKYSTTLIDMNLHYDPSNVCSQYNQHTVWRAENMVIYFYCSVVRIKKGTHHQTPCII